MRLCGSSLHVVCIGYCGIILANWSTVAIIHVLSSFKDWYLAFQLMYKKIVAASIDSSDL